MLDSLPWSSRSPVAASLIATAAIYAAARGGAARPAPSRCQPLPRALAFLRESVATLALLRGAVAAGARRSRPLGRPHRVALVDSRAVLLDQRLLVSAPAPARPRLGQAPAVHDGSDRRARQTFAALDARIAALPPDLRAGARSDMAVGGLLAHRYAQARPAARVRHVVTLGDTASGQRRAAIPASGSTAQLIPPAPACSRSGEHRRDRDLLGFRRLAGAGRRRLLSGRLQHRRARHRPLRDAALASRRGPDRREPHGARAASIAPPSATTPHDGGA